MARPDNCPVCAAPLPLDAPGGFCPRCLAGLAAGLAPNLIENHAAGKSHSGTQTVRYFGDYALTGEIASGGMGVVYRARQISLNRAVALKMIRAGQFASPAEVQRFRTEAEAAANLEHPNIVPIYEVGEHEGRHYFSMKLVEGGSLAERISNFKFQISNRESARLISTIARAVHHAHQRGVLHRDLKPTNILLDQKGEPHLTDFGLAKLVQSDGDLTQTIAILGTPHYMAPEQAAGGSARVTTAADVFSLGAILYELLVGHPPFQGASALEVLQHAQHREPDPPRGTNPSLDRDLETICLRCLEKEPSRRYDTAEALAEDLDHWLGGEPIQARPVSRPERVFKWTRRNPAIATLIALAHVLFLAGVIGVVREWRRAEAEADRATANATRAEAHARQAAANATRAEAHQRQAEAETLRSQQVAQFIKDMLQGIGPSVALGRDTMILREIVDQTARRLDALKDQPVVLADLCETLGIIYRELSDYTQAEAMLEQAVELRRQLHHGDHPELAGAIHHLAELFRLEGRNTEAEAGFRQALVVRRNALGEEHADVAASLYGLAEVLRRDGSSRTEAEAAHRQALAIRRQLLGREHLEVARSLTGLAVLLRNLEGGLAEAETCLREALDIQRQALGPEHPDIAYTLQNLGYTVGRQTERKTESQALLRETVAMQKKLLGDHRDTAMSIRFLANTVTNESDALALHREALGMRRKVLGVSHPDTRDSLNSVVNLLRQLGQSDEANALLLDDLELRRELLGDEHPEAIPAMLSLAGTLIKEKKLTEAEAILSKATAIQEQLGSMEGVALAKALYDAAKAFGVAGQWSKAELIYRQSLALRRKHLGDEHPDVAQSLYSVAEAMRHLGKHREAEPLCREHLAMRRKLGGDAHGIAGSETQLADSLLRLGRADEAEPLFRQAAEKGHRWAQWNLGRLYDQGIIVSRDLDEALKWYRKSAASQYSYAQFRLGQACASGEGVPKDEREAARWYRLAADQGHADAQYQLALLYATGQGVTKDTEEVLRWLRKAEAQGNQAARDKLAELTGSKADTETKLRAELSQHRTNSGEPHPDTGKAMLNLANFLRREHRLVEAEALYREELAWRKKLSGDEHPSAGNSWMVLGEVLREQDKPSEAEAAFRAALAIRRQQSDNDADVAHTLLWLSSVLTDQGRAAEAEAAVRESLELRRTRFGDKSEPFAAALDWLGRALQEQRKLAEAEAALREAATIRTQFSGADHANVLSLERKLARLLYDQGKFAKLAELSRARIERVRRLPPGELAAQTAMLAEWAGWLCEGRQFSDAEVLARECLTIPDHWLTFNARSLLGHCLLGLETYAEAEPLLLSGYEGMKQREESIPASVRSTRLKEAVQRLVQLYEATARPEQAAEWKGKLGEFEQAESAGKP